MGQSSPKQKKIMSTQPIPKSPRELLSERITNEVRDAIRYECASTEPALTEAETALIENEFLIRTRRLLDALSSAEMSSERALLAHLNDARGEANRLIRQRPLAAGTETDPAI